MEELKVVVAGATGYLGRFVVEALHREGYRVRALARDPERLGHVRELCDEVVVAEATRPETLAELCNGANIVFSSLGKRNFSRRPTIWEVDYQANLNILERARQAGVEHFVFISAIGADTLRRKGVKVAEARERVVDELEASGMAWTVFRPNGFFNDMEEMFRMAQKGTGWMVGGGNFVMNPIHGADLAAEVVRSLGAPEARNQALPLGGPDYFSMREILELAFDALGKPPRIRSLPRWLLPPARVVVQPFNPMVAGVIQAVYHMADVDLRAPACGTHHLKDFYAELARSAR